MIFTLTSSFIVITDVNTVRFLIKRPEHINIIRLHIIVPITRERISIMDEREEEEDEEEEDDVAIVSDVDVDVKLLEMIEELESKKQIYIDDRVSIIKHAYFPFAPSCCI